MRAHYLVFYLLITLSAQSVNAKDVVIAVASNFTKPMQRLARDFEATTGYNVRLSFGSSGKLYAQIVHGAPYHAFFSADQSKIDALLRDGLIVESSRFTYAVGQLALWAPTLGAKSHVFDVLKNGNFKKLALANPKLAPYGTAAMQTLEKLGLQQVTAPKWVLGENIAQTYQFVYSQNAEIGFIALSQLSQREVENQATTWIVPDKHYSAIKQDAALLIRGQHVTAAKQFLLFIQATENRQVIASFGYQLQHHTEQ